MTSRRIAVPLISLCPIPGTSGASAPARVPPIITWSTKWNSTPPPAEARCHALFAEQHSPPTPIPEPFLNHPDHRFMEQRQRHRAHRGHLCPGRKESSHRKSTTRSSSEGGRGAALDRGVRYPPQHLLPLSPQCDHNGQGAQLNPRRDVCPSTDTYLDVN